MKPRPTYDHPLHELIAKRWSPRAFAPQLLTDEQVLTLFEAARWAASCNNDQPWRFIWSHKDGSELYNKLFDCFTPGNQRWVHTAPLLVLTLIKTTFSFDGKPYPWAGHDLGLAIGNLTTQASAMDIYVHSMAGFLPEKVQEHFTLPEDVKPMTMIAIGYIGEIDQLAEFDQKREWELQTRKPLSELFLN